MGHSAAKFMFLCTVNFICIQSAFTKGLPYRCYFSRTLYFSQYTLVELYCQTPPETILFS